MHAFKLCGALRTTAGSMWCRSRQFGHGIFCQFPKPEPIRRATASRWLQCAFRAYSSLRACSIDKAQELACQRRNRFYHSSAAGAQPQDRNKICWRCQQANARTALLCDNERCRAIQPIAKDVTYFDLLSDDGQATFDVNPSELRRRFLRLQQAVHPDSFSQKEEMERNLAESQSSWVNHAYSTLKDPLPRARYLLKLQGREVGEKDQLTDPGLLMEVMESREEIEMAQTESQIADIRLRNEKRVSDIVSSLSQAFSRGDLDRARDLTHHLQYLRRIAQTVHGWEPSKA
ncbi:molecular chaperone [Coemansia sp. BCRC 34301]|nr:molecular chaperone [Coemansia sp. BCRC 34301]